LYFIIEKAKINTLKGENMDLSEIFQEDTGTITAPQEEDLSTITSLARMQINYQREIEKAELSLKDLREKLRKIEQEDLPEAILATGLRSLTLESGQKIMISDEITATIKADNKEEAFGWIRGQGYGSLIKHDVNTQFKKGEEEAARHFIDYLQDNGFAYSDKESIHWQTLRKFAKDLMEEGKPLPPEIDIYEYKKAIIK